MNFPVFTQLAGNFRFPETGSLETASSSGESTNFWFLLITAGPGSQGRQPRAHQRAADRRKSARSAQRFLSMHAAVHNTFNL